jgi:hypothetical protein
MRNVSTKIAEVVGERRRAVKREEDRAARAVVTLSCLAMGLIFLGHGVGIASAQVLYGSIVGTVTYQTNAGSPRPLSSGVPKSVFQGLSHRVSI